VAELSDFFFFLILHNIQLTPQKLSTGRKNLPGTPGASSGQKTKRGIEGEDPAAAGIERLFSLKGPREENNVRAFSFFDWAPHAVSANVCGWPSVVSAIVFLYLFWILD